MCHFPVPFIYLATSRLQGVSPELSLTTVWIVNVVCKVMKRPPKKLSRPSFNDNVVVKFLKGFTADDEDMQSFLQCSSVITVSMHF